jgi:hypothetical protein
MDDDSFWLGARAVAGLVSALLFFVAGYKLTGTGDSVIGPLGWALYGVSALVVMAAIPRPQRVPRRPGAPPDAARTTCPECGKPTLRTSVTGHLVSVHGYSPDDAEAATRE